MDWHGWRVSPNYGYLLGVPIIRFVIFGRLYWGSLSSLVYGNYQVGTKTLLSQDQGLAF